MDIISATYIKSSPGYKDCPEPDDPEYAFIGRSNVGKSSLINLLTNKINLAKTSATPGKTQLINHFLVTTKQLPSEKNMQPKTSESSRRPSPLSGEGSGMRPYRPSPLRGEGKGLRSWFLVDLPGYG